MYALMKFRTIFQVKCAQYWPPREVREAVFEDTNFKLTLLSEDIKSYYTVRQLELENLSVRFLFLCCVIFCSTLTSYYNLKLGTKA